MASVLAGKSLRFDLDLVKVQTETYRAINDGFRIIVNQGGSRSGKTFGVMKLLIALAYKSKYSISVTSLSFPHLRKGAMRDWRTIMEQYEIYDPERHIKTEQTYQFPTGSYMEFFSVDNNLKVRGPGRDILFINECNLLPSFDTFVQLLLRTKKCAIIDYNPADEFHWIYEQVLTRPDCYFIKSTYRDNPFLPHEQVKEIENLKNIDDNYWRIYGEGERGHSEGVIYTHWSLAVTDSCDSETYGLDFGYNNASALVRVREKDQNLYAEELIYQTHLTNQDLIALIKQNVPQHAKIFCDHENDRIEEIRKAGYQAVKANKNVKDGIDNIKRRRLFISPDSINLIKEIKSYKYQAKKKIEEPVKLNDHACDAMRYAAMGLKAPKNNSIPSTFKLHDKSNDKQKDLIY